MCNLIYICEASLVSDIHSESGPSPRDLEGCVSSLA